MKYILLPILLSMLLCISGCFRGDGGNGQILDSIDSLIGVNPDSAAVLLRSIPTDGMSRRQHALHGLLTIKAADKAYLTHPDGADSIVREAIDVFSSSPFMKAQSEYYGARVAIEANDMLHGLDYLEEAINSLGSDTTKRANELRACIISQNAQLFSSLNLFNEAIPFYIQAIELDKCNADTLGLALDIMSATTSLININRIDCADSLINNAILIKNGLTQSIYNEIEIKKRNILYRKGNYRDAVSNIDSLIVSINPNFTSYPMMVAAKAYYKLGEQDSANYYASKILERSYSSNKHIASMILLENSLRSIGDTSAIKYFQIYKENMNRLVATSSNSPEVVNTEFLKYRTEQKLSNKLKNKVRSAHNIIIIFMAVTIVLLIVYIWYRIHKAKKIQRLLSISRNMAALAYNLQCKNNDLSEVNRKLNELYGISTYSDDELHEKISEISQLISDKESQQAKERELAGVLSEISKKTEDAVLRREKLSSLMFEKINSIEVENLVIDDSNIYSTLKGLLENGKGIPDQSPLWNELDENVNSGSYNFRTNVALLFGKCDGNYYRLALLIKAGFSPSDCSVLMYKNISTVSNYRRTLVKNAFDNRINISNIDVIIRLL